MFGNLKKPQNSSPNLKYKVYPAIDISKQNLFAKCICKICLGF